MTNEVSLKFLLDELRALINELKGNNQKKEITNEQIDSKEDQMSEDELECLQQQFADADLYYPEEDFSHASDELAVPTESVLRLTDNSISTSFLPESAPVSAVTMFPQDLVLVCSASAPTVQSFANNSITGYNQCFLVDVLPLLREFAQHAAPCSSENTTGYKLWKPGLRSA